MKNTNLPYNVMNHANQWERAPRDPISVAIATFVAGGSTSTFLYFATLAVSSIAVSLVTSAIIGALMPKPDFGSNNSGQLLSNGKDALANSQFVYGQSRKGGVITFIESTGTNNKILHQIITLANHEVEEIGDIYLNDEIVTMSGEDVTSEPYDGFVKIYKHDGSQTSANTPFSNSSSNLANTLHNETETSMDSSFVGKGVAYLYCRFTYDQDAFANGLPTVTAVVKGKKVVKTVNGVAQAPVYSNNAAWCIRDLITSSYGLGDDSISDATFEAAAAICDDTTVLSDNSPQYTMNGVISSSESIGTVLQNMMTTCGGTLFWGAGSWRLYVGDYITPTKTLTLDDLRSGISLDTKISMRDNFNAVQGTFIDSSQDFISSSYPQVSSDLFLGEDNNVETTLDLNLPFTTNSVAAQRLAKQMLYRNREQLTLSASFGMNAFDVEVGDFIKFRNERYEWGYDNLGQLDGSEKVFEVTGWKLGFDSDNQAIMVNLTMRESSAAAFGFTAADEQTIINNNSTLLRYYDVPDITVSATNEYREVNENVVNALVVQVVSSQTERIDSVILKYKKTSEANFKSVGQTILLNEGNSAGRFEIVGVDAPLSGQPPIEYTISVTPVNSLGYKGVARTITHDIEADNQAPASPASLTHVLSGGTLFFSWPSVADLDLSHYRLFFSANPSSNFGDGSVLEVVEKIARPATSVSYPALAGKFFIAAVDKSGNISLTAATTTVLASELPQLGFSVTHDEHASFSGFKHNLTVAGGSLFMGVYTSSGSTGTYEFDHEGSSYIDVGATRTVRLSSSVTVARKHEDAVSGSVDWEDIPGNFQTWPDTFTTWTDETANFNDFAVVVEARAAPTGAGMSSAPWVTASGEIVGRYIQFRATLSNTNAKVTPNITALSATVEY